VTTRAAADLLFVLDASGSMSPCFQALRKRIVDFAKATAGPNMAMLDLRLGFVAMKADPDSHTWITECCVPRISAWDALYGGNQQVLDSFWCDASQFARQIAEIETGADEDTLMAIDFALDAPWRTHQTCHRVVVTLTDEPPETGVRPEERRLRIPELVAKINALHVKLFIVGPYSEMLVELEAADKCEYFQIADADVGRGLASFDFGRLLASIGKSISIPTLQARSVPVRRALFGQDRWVTGGDFRMDSGS